MNGSLAISDESVGRKGGVCGIGAIALALSMVSSIALAAPADEADFRELASRCAPNVHATTISAIVMQESGARPYAIGINGGTAKLARQPRTLSEAIATANWLRNGGHNFDAGLGQINVKNMEWLGLEVADLFDPCKNLRAAAVVIGDCYERASRRFGQGQPALRAALSCYNTGNFSRGFSNGYVGKVGARVGVAVPGVVVASEPRGAVAVAEQVAPSPPGETGGGGAREMTDAFARGVTARRDPAG